jgi:hypothetical protein
LVTFITLFHYVKQLSLYQYNEILRIDWLSGYPAWPTALALDGNEDMHSKVRTETITYVYEHWAQFACYITGMVDPRSTVGVHKREEVVFMQISHK